MEPAFGRIDRFIGGLGSLTGAVEQALRAVPRHDFIPAVALAHGDDDQVRVIDREADPGSWWDAVYSGMPIVTQLNDGTLAVADVIGEDGTVEMPHGVAYSSSSSAPRTVADLLEWLDPAPGNRVLEIGTGTGWTAALLSHLVGAELVTSVEIDPAVAEQAAKNLVVSGHRPRLVVGDGAVGHADDGPYDRVHVTCGIRAVPYAWVRQTRPGGRIVLPYCPGFGADHALRLVVMPDGTAHGRFPGLASYMMMRSQRTPADRFALDHDRERRYETRVDPRTVAHAPAGADLAISALTGLRSVVQKGEDYHQIWVYDDAEAGTAGVTWVLGEDEIEVRQYGDRQVWEEVVDAYFRWVSWGEPARTRFGTTVTPEGQRMWLDDPGNVIG